MFVISRTNGSPTFQKKVSKKASKLNISQEEINKEIVEKVIKKTKNQCKKVI